MQTAACLSSFSVVGSQRIKQQELLDISTGDHAAQSRRWLVGSSLRPFSSHAPLFSSWVWQLSIFWDKVETFLRDFSDLHLSWIKIRQLGTASKYRFFLSKI
ncbi:hypothetical protein OROGR_032916 [Orobanche gracilis]